MTDGSATTPAAGDGSSSYCPRRWPRSRSASAGRHSRTPTSRRPVDQVRDAVGDGCQRQPGLAESDEDHRPEPCDLAYDADRGVRVVLQRHPGHGRRFGRQRGEVLRRLVGPAELLTGRCVPGQWNADRPVPEHGELVHPAGAPARTRNDHERRPPTAPADACPSGSRECRRADGRRGSHPQYTSSARPHHCLLRSISDPTVLRNAVSGDRPRDDSPVRQGIEQIRLTRTGGSASAGTRPVTKVSPTTVDIPGDNPVEPPVEGQRESDTGHVRPSAAVHRPWVQTDPHLGTSMWTSGSTCGRGASRPKLSTGVHSCPPNRHQGCPHRRDRADLHGSRDVPTTHTPYYCYWKSFSLEEN